jgi:hypothetical protein
VYTFNHMNTYKLYSLVKLSFFTGIIILSVSIAFFLPKVQEKVNPPFVNNTESLGTDFKSVTTTLGISLGLSPNELANFSCNKDRLPTLGKKDFFWQVVCENKVGTPYIGVYWKRPDYQKITFQNGVLNEFLKNKSTREKTNYNGKFSCSENKKRKDKTKMSSAIVDCVTTIANSKVKLYTTFIYSYPIESVSLSANSVIVISSLSEKETSETVSYIFSKLHKISTTNNKNIYSNSFIEKAYASAGGAAGSGGTGAGVGDCGTGSAGTGTGSCGPGDSGAAASGDSGTSGGDPASGPVGDGVSTSPSVCTNGATDWPTCTPIIWTPYCTGATDPNGNYWQIWEVSNQTPPNYRNTGGTCTPPAAPVVNIKFN